MSTIAERVPIHDCSGENQKVAWERQAVGTQWLVLYRGLQRPTKEHLGGVSTIDLGLTNTGALGSRFDLLIFSTLGTASYAEPLSCACRTRFLTRSKSMPPPPPPRAHRHLHGEVAELLLVELAIVVVTPALAIDRCAQENAEEPRVKFVL